MVEVLIAERGDLGGAELDAAERLVRSAFGSSFRSHDWLHAVEGVHVVLTAEQSLVAFAAVVARTLHHNGIAFDTGYVEGVAVRADQQGCGLGRLVMDHAENIIRTRHQLGALNAVETATDFYAARGWRAWTGHTQAVGPAGVIDTYDHADRIYLLHPAGVDQPFDSETALICDWRPGDLW
ncbi:GNAT family N-acetyltransferase [Mycolicibacterium komossense]|uniref:GNAT family N-acetyltransferase n=1 Tax=Mycolicibacterium komossense TaxID=1779 RepID=A0ABT3CFF2_9MYCO|nr:GNAT family N-acetyltransferase [Mycolicibacterium komossense]MCV7228223.1 GNAT family N-acetyltransferase [Mycolicibacterium komossense]